MFVPCGESVPDLTNFTLLMVSLHLSLALSPSRPVKRHLVLGEPDSWLLLEVVAVSAIKTRPLAIAFVACRL